ncbi:hypothetical protein BDF20DRAFT_912319 [Mycotypha africana]|uniref:uncharacterized protein n=1 Tax=Mycotypha africana TaxID=64632 RepID=UPI002301F7CB|nr:uncharacterized protein BDF20DRAFT_912319 [Mycotypha africana]KAI8982110.1 hypothetical protein BDF20DRAFT_912319 [Mycotypha africana]
MLQASKSPFSSITPRRRQFPDDRVEALITQLFKSTAKGKTHKTAKAAEWLQFMEHINPSMFVLTDRQLVHLSRFAIANQEVDMTIAEFNRLIHQVKKEVPSTIYDQRTDSAELDSDQDIETDNDNMNDEEEEEEEVEDPTQYEPYYVENDQQKQKQQRKSNRALLHSFQNRHDLFQPLDATRAFSSAGASSLFEDKESLNHPDSANFLLPVRRQSKEPEFDYEQLTELNLLKRDKAELTTRLQEFNKRVGQMELEVEQQKILSNELKQKEFEHLKKLKELQELVEEYKAKSMIAERQLQEKDEEINKLKTALGNTEAGELFDETKMLYEELQKEMESQKDLKKQLESLKEANTELESKLLEQEQNSAKISKAAEEEIARLKKTNEDLTKEVHATKSKAIAQEAHLNDIIRQQGERSVAVKAKADQEFQQLQEQLSDLNMLQQKYGEQSKALEAVEEQRIAEIRQLEEELEDAKKLLTGTKKTATQNVLSWLSWVLMFFLCYVVSQISVYVQVNQTRPGAYTAPFQFMDTICEWLLAEDFVPSVNT